MDEIDVFQKMHNAQAAKIVTQQEKKLIQHKSWLSSLKHERPSPRTDYRVGIYIRYFNQTKHDNYLEYHKAQYKRVMDQCPNWELVDFYVDEGATAPNMENAPAWSRLLRDSMGGMINLIITQKISNISKKPYEASLCARLLAAQEPPIGIYFVSEDLFTLASYYQEDLHDPEFFPSEDWQILPDDDFAIRGYLDD